MSKSVRIRTTPNGDDSYLKVKVEQDFDFVEILSLRISQAEAYSRFCSDYGVIVGRVIVNDGFGVSNAKVSVFVPLTDDDSDDSEISGLYPFETIDDKDNDGIRYNLLQKDNNPQEDCFTPVGSFSAKREVIDNDTVLEVYDRYYKYTTTTNSAGDFMLFGVPTGPQIVNVDVDLSDVGIISQRPYDYIAQGEDKRRFKSPTKFKEDNDLDKLLQIKSYKKGVNVQPFWGDKEQCDIGINRLDINIKKKIIPAAIFIGSLFSDSEKNSINKNCRPRKDMGRMCETEAGQGSIEMIRKTLDGGIERFDVEGGRVVNEFGAWAYQVPMNLDYMVTDEFGNIVPTDDPNKGIATRANVRFRVSKDVTGGEGKLRTTANYLVPHNPNNSNDIDYNFDENTGPNHFRNLHWNKIYTVSNYIPRIQAICEVACADNRNMTGIKDVDDCVGEKTPFPYNRVDTDPNPLFTIICIIISIIVFIVWLINSIIVSLINYILVVLNGILEVICDIVWGLNFLTFKKSKKCDFCMGTEVKDSDGHCTDCICDDVLDYVSCIVLECSADTGDPNDANYSPGCLCDDNDVWTESSSSSIDDSNLGCWAARVYNPPNKTIRHWSGLLFESDHCPHDGHNTIGAGFTDCIAIKLAEQLNMFEFDFYNDWINGTLYTYLLKYKTKKSEKQKFCDSDCDTPDSDNGCDKSWFVDACVASTHWLDDRLAIKQTTKLGINEGFIKQVTKVLPDGKKVDTLYYAPYGSVVEAKLFATELVHLGSVFDCDWQGIPKLQPFLIPTTYKRPPYVDQYLIVNNKSTSQKSTCGMTSTGINGSSGLFFDIDCDGLTVGEINGKPRCNNFKRICEHGIDIDLAVFTQPDIWAAPPNCYIDNGDITQPWGGLFRDVFMRLNENDGPTKLDSWPLLTGLPITDTSFNTSGLAYPSADNGDYTDFRDGSQSLTNAYDTTGLGNTDYRQTNNSFYFYFGTKPSSSAIELMNSKYFTECEVVLKNDFIISGIVTDATTPSVCDGSIDTTIVGGEFPYTYLWTVPSGSPSIPTNDDYPINLCPGIYTLTVTDALGGSSTIQFTVNSPSPLDCNTNAVSAFFPGGDGELTIEASGGVPDYTYIITGGGLGTPIGPILMATTITTEILPMHTNPYIVQITDSNGDTCTNPITGVTITGPPLLSATGCATRTHTTCGEDNGTITITPSCMGGSPPLAIQTTNTSGFNSNAYNISNLTAGAYTVTVSDSTPYTAQTDSVNLTINNSYPPTIFYAPLSPDWYCWIYGDDPQIYPQFTVTTSSSSFPATIKAQELDSVGAPVGGPVIETVMGSPHTFTQQLNPAKYDFTIIENSTPVCSATETDIDFRVGEGRVPAMPLRFEQTTKKYCWLGGSASVTITPEFNVWHAGRFIIYLGSVTPPSPPVSPTQIIYDSLTDLWDSGNPLPFGATVTANGGSVTPIAGQYDISINPSSASGFLQEYTIWDMDNDCYYSYTHDYSANLPTQLNNNTSYGLYATLSQGGIFGTEKQLNVTTPSGGYPPVTYEYQRWYSGTFNTVVSITTPNYLVPNTAGDRWQVKLVDNRPPADGGSCTFTTNEIIIPI